MAALGLDVGEVIVTDDLELGPTVEKLPSLKGFGMIVLSRNPLCGTWGSGVGIVAVSSITRC